MEPKWELKSVKNRLWEGSWCRGASQRVPKGPQGDKSSQKLTKNGNKIPNKLPKMGSLRVDFGMIRTEDGEDRQDTQDRQDRQYRQNRQDKDRQTDRQTDTQTDRQTERYTLRRRHQGDSSETAGRQQGDSRETAESRET